MTDGVCTALLPAVAAVLGFAGWVPTASAQQATEAPVSLQCLAHYYAGQPVATQRGWVLRLPNGIEIPYDDGKSKTFDQMLEAPDVKDVFSIRYDTGPLEPVTAVDHDPGRVRIDAVFRAAFGHSKHEVERQTVPWHFRGRTLPVHHRVEAAFQRVEQRLGDALATSPSLLPFLQNPGGTFNWRYIAGTHRMSAHAYGVSLDINVSFSDYWLGQEPLNPIRWKNKIPQAIVDAFEAEGFAWGGRWYHYDTMHFEYRPELLDPRCYP